MNILKRIYHTLFTFIKKEKQTVLSPNFSMPLSKLEDQVEGEFVDFFDSFGEAIANHADILVRKFCVTCHNKDNFELIKICSYSVSTLQILIRFFEEFIKTISKDYTPFLDPRIIILFRDIIHKSNDLLDFIELKET